jgi:carboxyl-terminal processing protease
VRTTGEAQALVREVARAAEQALGLKQSATVLAFACGACCGLDEYTAYLTPSEFAEICASLRGEVVGVGLDVVAIDRRLTVSQVLAGSPAEASGIKSGDRLLRVGAREVAGLTAEAVAELLRGDAGTAIDLELLPAGEQHPRLVRLVRQAVLVPSVGEPRFLGDRMLGIGYLQVTLFQETTAREFDEAIFKLQMTGMRALILDLRGNPGGVVEAAVQLAERFIPDGIIVSTQGQGRANNRTHLANNPGALTIPLVVLIDSNTASAAELVAGALKHYGRARLVGQTTHGKGTVQRHGRLSASEAGVRITVARFFGPAGQAYSGAGVTPDVEVEGSLTAWSMDVEQDPQVRAALEAARQLLLGR